MNEAATIALGVAAPQAIKAAIASGHHGVPFSLKKATRKEDVHGLVKGQRGQGGSLPNLQQDK
jgi:hypothetical protein